jgi:hypothetical protein
MDGSKRSLFERVSIWYPAASENRTRFVCGKWRGDVESGKRTGESPKKHG